MTSSRDHGMNKMVKELTNSTYGNYSGSLKATNPDEGQEGRFGRLFAVDNSERKEEGVRNTPHAAPTYVLHALGETFVPKGEDIDEDSTTPAGLTFLGQFIDHDITLDTTSSFASPQDPTAVLNKRTPGLDLDCIYGGGPEASPHLYRDGPTPESPYLITGTTLAKNSYTGIEDKIEEIRELNEKATEEKLGDAIQDCLSAYHLSDARFDVPRNQAGRAIIGDPRNDENILISQIQALIIKLHNKLQATYTEKGFEEIRAYVTHYYHRVIIEEFLPFIIGWDVFSDIANNGRQLYYPNGMTHSKTGQVLAPFMPVEFSVAAYRFGHAQVRSEYRLHGKGKNAKTVPLFNADDPGLRGFRPVTLDTQIDWELFFEIYVENDGARLKARPQFARKLDTVLAKPLSVLPFVPAENPASERNLAARNLGRGRVFRLPTGEDVASQIKFPKHIQEQINEKPFETSEQVKNLGMRDTPLWFYILQEAKQHGLPGDKLGPVGGRIVGEVFHGLLDNFRNRTGEGLDLIVNLEEEVEIGAATVSGRVEELAYKNDSGLGFKVQTNIITIGQIAKFVGWG